MVLVAVVSFRTEACCTLTFGPSAGFGFVREGQDVNWKKAASCCCEGKLRAGSRSRCEVALALGNGLKYTVPRNGGAQGEEISQQDMDGSVFLCASASSTTSFNMGRTRSVRRKAKFQGFDAVGVKETPVQDGEDATKELPSVEEPGSQVDTRDDRVLPGSLEESVVQASEATSLFCRAGGTRAIVELLVADFETLEEEGAQQQLWSCAHAFLNDLESNTKMKVRAVFPDAGAAAMLQHQWRDELNFTITSLNDRRPEGKLEEGEEEVIVLVLPGHQSLAEVERLAARLAAEDGPTRPLVMWNPRLFSGDVGIGLNVRRLRDEFLSTFTYVYSLRPLPVGAVYRAYPGPWTLFRDDPDVPGRYLLVMQQGSKPDYDDIESLYNAAASRGNSDASSGESNERASPSLLEQAMAAISSLSRFMKALSR